MNILAIGAHPDDLEFLCAGTLALYARAGHRVVMAVATNGNVGSPTLSKEEIRAVRKAEQEAACAIIGAELIWMDFDDEWLFNDRQTRTVFLDAYRRADPDVVFVHGPNDYHPDHRVAGQVAEDCRIPAAVRLVETTLPACRKVPHLFRMDTIGSIEFEPEAYVDITSVMDIKRRMLACHESQTAWLQAIYDLTPVEMMESMGRQRGLVAGVRFAEGFAEVKTYPRTGSQALLPNTV
jgi:LmbE family N-acetylglucosaminyl deacetylase